MDPALSSDGPAPGFLPAWLAPYALAACLAGVVIFQGCLVYALNARLATERRAHAQVRPDVSMLQLRLAELAPKDVNYLNARVLVAWDIRTRRGVISMQNLPAPPAGRDYQLWVLDPSADGPVNAGLLTRDARAQDFAARPVRTATPGFAISLELAGGRPAPSPGAILFAVAPGQ